MGRLPQLARVVQKRQKRKRPEASASRRRKLGSPSWARTNDPRINSPLLYRLSYRGIAEPKLYRESVTLARSFDEKIARNLDVSGNSLILKERFFQCFPASFLTTERWRSTWQRIRRSWCSDRRCRCGRCARRRCRIHQPDDQFVPATGQ